MGELEVQKKTTKRPKVFLEFFSGCFAVGVGGIWFPLSGPFQSERLCKCTPVHTCAHPEMAGIKELCSSAHIISTFPIMAQEEICLRNSEISFDEQGSVKYELIHYLGVSGNGDHCQVIRRGWFVLTDK